MLCAVMEIKVSLCTRYHDVFFLGMDRSSEFLKSYTYCFDLGDIFVTHIVQVGTTHAQLGLVSVSFVISTF